MGVFLFHVHDAMQAGASKEEVAETVAGCNFDGGAGPQWCMV